MLAHVPPQRAAFPSRVLPYSLSCRVRAWSLHSSAGIRPLPIAGSEIRRCQLALPPGCASADTCTSYMTPICKTPLQYLIDHLLSLASSGLGKSGPDGEDPADAPRHIASQARPLDVVVQYEK